MGGSLGRVPAAHLGGGSAARGAWEAELRQVPAGARPQERRDRRCDLQKRPELGLRL